jgi:putative heme-binding domain-containing protein
MRFATHLTVCLLAVCLLIRASVRADEAPDLGPLVKVLAEVDDAGFQLDLLKGIRDGLRGRKSLPTPDGWPAVYAKLRKSPNQEVRELSRVLALIFGDAQALTSLRATMLDRTAEPQSRREALEVLVEKRAANLAPTLQGLLDDRNLRGSAIRGLAAYDDAKTPTALLAHLDSFSDKRRLDAVATLSSRPKYATALLSAVGAGKFKRHEISAFTARQLYDLGDEDIRKQLAKVWGEIRQTSKAKKALIAKYKAALTPKALKKASLNRGRLVFSRTCMKCHIMFGEGGKIGPDLTGSNRANLDYVLQNVLDPSASIGKGYQLTNVISADGRLVAGIVIEETAAAVTLQTVNEKVVLPRGDIETMKASPISMMPEGQFDKLSKDDVRDLVAYLASPLQVFLPPPARALLRVRP